MTLSAGISYFVAALIVLGLMRNAFVLWRKRNNASLEISKRRKNADGNCVGMWANLKAGEMDELRKRRKLIKGYPEPANIANGGDARLYRDTAEENAEKLDVFAPILYTVIAMVLTFSFSEWLADMSNYLEYGPPDFSWKSLTMAFFLFMLSIPASLQMRARSLRSYAAMYNSLAKAMDAKVEHSRYSKNSHWVLRCFQFWIRRTD